MGGSSWSEVALSDQCAYCDTTRLVDRWAWRAGKTRDCVFYKPTERGEQVDGGTRKGKLRHVPPSRSLKDHNIERLRSFLLHK
jgi:hypothetical protein